MHPFLADIEPGSLAALYLFAIAGLVIAVALVGAGLMALKKLDRKTARFYLLLAAVCCGVALLLMLVARTFGKGQP
jgi:amino acid transporter